MKKADYVDDMHQMMAYITKTLETCKQNIQQFHFDTQALNMLKREQVIEAHKWLKAQYDGIQVRRMFKYFNLQPEQFWISTFVLGDEDLYEYVEMTERISEVQKIFRSSDKPDFFRKKELTRLIKRNKKSWLPKTNQQ